MLKKWALNILKPVLAGLAGTITISGGDRARLRAEAGLSDTQIDAVQAVLQEVVATKIASL